ncbi:Hpt domain-containing protein, partial [Thioclava sp. BHET1]
MLNWSHTDSLLKEIGPEDFREVMILFLEEVEDALRKLNPGASPARLERDMHFLHGSLLNLGFTDLAELCEAQERAAAAGEPVDTSAVQRAYEYAKPLFL